MPRRAPALLAALFLFVPGNAGAIIMELPGSTAQLLVDDPSKSFDGLALDASGNLYVTTGYVGILKVTPTGTVTPWSNSNGLGLVFAPDGTGYVAGRGLCHCIEQLSSNGQSSVLHADALEWTNLALLPDGSLYASVWAGTGEGLYRVDRATGQPTTIVLGGPGAGASGWYGRLAVGPAGTLYVNGYDPGGGYRLFRLDGSTLTPVGNPANGADVITEGPGGRYLAIAGIPGSLYLASELWLFDPLSGASNKVARTSIYFHEYDVQFSSAVYDASRSTVYVTENHRVWALHLDLSTSAQSVTWGALKAQYR